MTLQEAFRKLDDVRDEYDAARFSLGHTLRLYERNPAVHEVGAREQITLHDLQSCQRNLQITYLVRLFAEFEGILRAYWRDGRKRSTVPPMTDLLNGIAAYCFVNQDDLRLAHEVREYRNAVIHEHRQDPLFDFQTCRSRLASFVRWLPRRW